MQRIFAFALFVLLPLVGGCSKPQPAEPLTVGFSCEFRAQYNDLAAAGTLTRQTAESVSLEFSEPDTLKGLTAKWDGQTVRLQYLGLSYSVDPNDLPENALGEQLLSVFQTVLQHHGDSIQENGRVTVTGLNGNNPYSYVYDAESGMPLSLSVPAIPLTVTFSNVTK